MTNETCLFQAVSARMAALDVVAKVLGENLTTRVVPIIKREKRFTRDYPRVGTARRVGVSAFIKSSNFVSTIM